MTEPGFWQSRVPNVVLFLLLPWNEHSGEVSPNFFLQMGALCNSETLLREKVVCGKSYKFTPPSFLRSSHE